MVTVDVKLPVTTSGSFPLGLLYLCLQVPYAFAVLSQSVISVVTVACAINQASVRFASTHHSAERGISIAVHLPPFFGFDHTVLASRKECHLRAKTLVF